jgi:NAD(P)-dependent dehydrogenase (short-subunit alcohol dehydrogenase family)
MGSLKLSDRYPSKRAFITGAGSGLGRALSLHLAADGWTIGITDISTPNVLESKALIVAKGGKAIEYTFDVSKKDAYKQAFRDYISQTGGIDLLINNAGVGDGGLFDEYSLENWDWIVGINELAVIYGSFFAAPVMKKQGAGHIISIASAAGYATPPNMSMYNVTKASVIAFSESIYTELKPFGIDVSVVTPTFFRTNIMQAAKGPQDAVATGTAILKKAPILPSEVAEKILTEAGQRTFQIFHPFQAKLIWYAKRFIPGLMRRFQANGFAKKGWIIKKVAEARAK